LELPHWSEGLFDASQGTIANRTEMKGDDYYTGRHFWTHFWCGLAVGGGLGAWLSWGMFASRWAVFGAAALFALLFGCCAGKWGDSFWFWILDLW
jgi:hypothetical protein